MIYTRSDYRMVAWRNCWLYDW